MNIKLNLSIIFCLLIFSKSFGQITVTLDQIYLNNQTSIENCSTVDFGTTANNNLLFYFTLEKATNQVGGSNGTIKVILKHNSASSGDILVSSVVPNWANSDILSHSIPATVNENQIQVSGSSILLEYEDGGTYESCEYPLIKTPTPTFELDDDSYTISCGSTSPRTFTVNNVNSSPGTLSYSWNVGSGWKLNGSPVSGSFTTTTNSIVLEPNSSTILPSNVSVTTSLNGVAYPTKTATVTRGGYNPVYQITGSNQLCSTATYSVSNLPAGTTLSSWTSSNPAVATMTTNSKNKGVLTAVGNGIITVSATLTNACGQTAIITKNNIGVGAPTVNNFGINGSSSSIYVNSVSYFSVSPVTGNTSYYWWITPAGGCSAGSGPTINNVNPYTSSSTSVQINWGACPGTYSVVCWAENDCSNTFIGQKFVTVKGLNEPCNNNFSLRVSPNPNKGKEIGVTVNLVPNPEPCPTNALSRTINKEYHVEVYDFYGMKKFSGDYKSEKMTLGNLRLKKGTYFVKVTSSGGINESKTLIID